MVAVPHRHSSFPCLEFETAGRRDRGFPVGFGGLIFSFALPAFGNLAEPDPDPSWNLDPGAPLFVTAVLVLALVLRLAYLLTRTAALRSEVKTLRRRAEDLEGRLDAEGRRLAFLLAEQDGGTLWLDSEGRIHAVDAEARSVLGRRNNEELVGLPAESALALRLVNDAGVVDASPRWLEGLRDAAVNDGRSSTRAVLLDQHRGTVSLRLGFLRARVADDREGSFEGLLRVQSASPGLSSDEEPDADLDLRRLGLRYLAGDFAREIERALLEVRRRLEPRSGEARDGDFRASDILPGVKAAERAAVQLVSFAAPPETDLPVSPGPLHLRDLLAQALGSAGFRVSLPGVPEDLPPIAGDPGRSLFVVRSVLDLFRRLAKPEDVPRIEARLVPGTGRSDRDELSPLPGPRDALQRQAPRNNREHLQVVISGASRTLSKDQLSRLFLPPASSSAHSGNAAGIGLAAAKELMRRQRGSLAVASKEGSGSRFTLTFAVTSPEVARGIPGMSETIPGGDRPGTAAPPPGRRDGDRRPLHRPKPGERGRVLVMDDEQSILSLLSAALKRLGFEPTVTRDGQAALDATEAALRAEEPYRLAILDLTIPGGMGGVDAAERLGRLHPELILVASSGYAQNPALTDFTSYGFHAALVKPYRIPDLSKLLDRLLDPNLDPEL